MPQNIIEVENISKLYKLGNIGTGTLSHDLNRWWSKVTKKEDPYMLAGEKNDRHAKGTSSYVWSLKDISFEIQRGDIFGVIGGNGAGKSTLLKILSKITKPTTGSIKLDGRIASLLEVGTGFHPELTGRENIYLNGAILGMRKQEIKKRFDEIVAFSEIGRYIDTPVKKYSSGMFVRLAFSVGAHLEPDILIIDEVLAVGDANFQSKCLGKMEDVSRNQGRTVLFVSHNIAAIKQLCNKAVLLEQGTQKMTGPIKDVLAAYQRRGVDTDAGKRKNLPLDAPGYFTEWELKGKNKDERHSCYTGDTCVFSFAFHAQENMKGCEVRFVIRYEEMFILNASSLSNNGTAFSVTPNNYRFSFKFDFPVKDAEFDIEVIFVSFGKIIDSWRSNTKFVVLDNLSSYLGAGLINPDAKFSMHEEGTILAV
ncbi:MAG: ABC transporter ATP-binding protein [Chitinophagaceae bacterium]|nr:ABC transporter ATP-binding protein [Chitinophagaceae bacterium]